MSLDEKEYRVLENADDGDTLDTLSQADRRILLDLEQDGYVSLTINITDEGKEAIEEYENEQEEDIDDDDDDDLEEEEEEDDEDDDDNLEDDEEDEE